MAVIVLTVAALKKNDGDSNENSVERMALLVGTASG